MSLSPNGEGKDHSSWPWRLVLLVRNNIWVRIPIVFGLAAYIGTGMLKLSEVVPGYVVVLLVYVLGLLGWGLLIGFPIGRKKDLMKVWVFFALLWASACCFLFAEGLRQNHENSWGTWSVIGWGLAVLAIIVFRVLFPRESSKNHNGE